MSDADLQRSRRGGDAGQDLCNVAAGRLAHGSCRRPPTNDSDASEPEIASPECVANRLRSHRTDAE